MFEVTHEYAQDFKMLQKQLESIGDEDQRYRLQIDSIEKKFGSESGELKDLWKTIHRSDSLNRVEVVRIIDNYGWMGPGQVGYAASSAMYYVIMHADLETQEKYISVIRDAVKEGKAEGGNLAMLEDRVALREGKKQIYGTQIRKNNITNEYYLAPLEDPLNVDERRVKMGMKTLGEYIKQYNIIWDPKTYVPKE